MYDPPFHAEAFLCVSSCLIFILYQALLLIARALLFAAFLSRSLLLFVVEAVVEGAMFITNDMHMDDEAAE